MCVYVRAPARAQDAEGVDKQHKTTRTDRIAGLVVGKEATGTVQPKDADDKASDKKFEAPHGRVHAAEHLLLLLYAQLSTCPWLRRVTRVRSLSIACHQQPGGPGHTARQKPEPMRHMANHRGLPWNLGGSIGVEHVFRGNRRELSRLRPVFFSQTLAIDRPQKTLEMGPIIVNSHLQTLNMLNVKMVLFI